jgi:hypothetical protein
MITLVSNTTCKTEERKTVLLLMENVLSTVEKKKTRRAMAKPGVQINVLSCAPCAPSCAASNGAGRLADWHAHVRYVSCPQRAGGTRPRHPSHLPCPPAASANLSSLIRQHHGEPPGRPATSATHAGAWHGFVPPRSRRARTHATQDAWSQRQPPAAARTLTASAPPIRAPAPARPARRPQAVRRPRRRLPSLAMPRNNSL